MDAQVALFVIGAFLLGGLAGSLIAIKKTKQKTAELSEVLNTEPPAIDDAFLPSLPIAKIKAYYNSAAGKELVSGKIDNPESSAALAANVFGLFIDRPKLFHFPPLPGSRDWGWPALSVELEQNVRFPWAGGLHPWLDLLIKTNTTVIGLECKRYEPFRSRSGDIKLSEAYWRDTWGEEMRGYKMIRDSIRDRPDKWVHLDAAQLFKHALALRTAVHSGKTEFAKKTPFLVYVFAEPKSWHSGKLIDPRAIKKHRDEIMEFDRIVSKDEVRFHHISYRELIDAWSRSDSRALRALAAAIRAFFDDNF